MEDSSISTKVEGSVHEFTLAGKNLLESLPDSVLENKKINRILEKLNKEHQDMSTNLLLVAKTLGDEGKTRRSRRYIRREHRRFKRLSKYIEKFEQSISGQDGSEEIIQNLERLGKVNNYIDRLLTSSLLADKDTEYVEEAKKLEPL